MRAIKAQKTKIEEKLVNGLKARGFRFQRNYQRIEGKPDIAFVRYKIAVFCDGDFWHGKDWETARDKIKSNEKFWHTKIEGNIKRDLKVNQVLTANGWTVLRFWESRINKNIEECINQIEFTIKQKMKKYSDFKDDLKINLKKDNLDKLAYLTHFWHNRSGKAEIFYKEEAERILKDLRENELTAAEKDENYLPFKWDVPFPPVGNPAFTFIDLFAGIGGFRIAFQNLKGKCIFSSEIDFNSRRTYEANFGEIPFGDITKIKEDEIPEHDILLGGFPCQPFSIAGVSKKKSLGLNHGFLDKTQGTLFFDIARIIKAKRPKMFLLENVKNLKSHDKGRTFEVIFNTLKELNYSVYSKVIDGKAYVPQHRERIFIVGFNNDVFNRQERFYFPEKDGEKHAIKSILELKVDDKYTLTDHLWAYLQNYAIKHKEKGNGFGFGLINPDEATRTLSARYYKDGSEILIPQEGKNPRRLTPRECARLQGFPDKFVIPVSDTQAYRQFGNAVVVPLIEQIGKHIIKAYNGYKRNNPDE
jgi:DNA (cytosine-5)-methyltransferase 1